jgi:glycosyltransferase involved in cell wall biosynthesis
MGTTSPTTLEGPSSMRFLIFDTILDGHHSDYINHLVEYWCGHQLPGEIYIITPRGFSESLSSQCRSYSGVTCIELTNAELQQVRGGATASQSFRVWNLYLQYAAKIRPTHALLMYFDLYQLGMWLGKKSPCPVSGIYFRPSFHYPGRHSLKERLKAFRKKWMLQRVLSLSELSNLFCLDRSSVLFIQKMTKRVRVLPLSDPVKNYQITASQVQNLRLSLGVRNDRKVFLMFGYLDERKGIEPVLDAIRQLSREESSRLTLVLAGPISDQYRLSINARIENMDNDTQIICQYTRFSGLDIQLFFELSDFVLTLYRRHIGMSSILVRAALSGKPLISSDFGYMGSLVKAKKLGMVVDSNSVPSIREALRQALKGEVRTSAEAIKKISEQNTSQLYAHQILSALEQIPVYPS